MSLTRDSILAARDFAIEEVPVAEWGGSIFVRTMSGLESDAYRKVIADTKGNEMQTCARYISACACDADGKLLFSEEDIPALAAKSKLVITRVFKAALKVNGIGKEAEDNAEKK